MNNMQIELLNKFGNKIICVDAKHGLNVNDFEMVSVSNRIDSYINKLFFTKIKQLVLLSLSFFIDATNVLIFFIFFDICNYCILQSIV